MKFIQRNDLEINRAECAVFQKELGISEITASILISRGLSTVDSAREYLGMTERAFSNPYDLSNMRDVVERINEAIKNNEKIVVYSDYDTDGVCGCSIMLNGFKSIGYENVSYYTPERIGEGYGLNPEAVGYLAREKCNLLITVDCGISNIEEIKLAKFLGVDVIVTDHHSCPPQLPNCLIVNPKLQGAKGQENLCGAAVAMKVAQAVFGGSAENIYMELAAIATVADMVPLKGENRHIVNAGLDIINTRPSKAIQALVEMTVGEKDVSSEDIGYKLGPIINAAGRISTAHICIELFTQKVDDIKASAAQLIEYNNERKDIQNDVYNQAKVMVEDLDLINNNGIVLFNEEWALGVVGIVASRLMNDYGRPIAILTKSNNKIKGSLRCVDGINIFDVLSNISELFDSFGGHSKAAGITLKSDNVAEFADRFNRELDGFDKSLFDKVVYYDIECSPSDITFDIIDEITSMEPFGQDNPSVSVLLRRTAVSDYFTMGKEKNHFRANFVKENDAIKGVGFFSSLPDGVSKGNMLCDVVIKPGINEFNGYRSVQGMIDGVSAYYPDEKSYINYIDSIREEFALSKAESESISKEEIDDISCEISSIDELKNALRDTSYQSIVVVDDIKTAKALYEVLTSEVMNKVHIAVGNVDTSVNGANTLLFAPRYKELKSNIYTRVYYVNVNENANIIKTLSQSLHDNIQMVIMSNINLEEVKTITIDRLRQIYKLLRGSKEIFVGADTLMAFGGKNGIEDFEMTAAKEIFTESGLLKVNDNTTEYCVMSKATIEVKETSAYKKYIIE